jgi:hypothetical protein
MASIGGVVQRGLGDGCSVLESHMVDMLSIAMVVSMIGLAWAMRISALKMDQRDSDDFFVMGMRRSL